MSWSWDIFLEELTAGLPDGSEIERAMVRLLAAFLLGGLVGYQRERVGKAAGLRTHMLVAMGSALFVLGSSAAGMTVEGTSRVVQGLATGIGFIGAGAILKRRDDREIEGLTTAAGIWMTAALGAVAGMGLIGLALLGGIFAWVALSTVGFLETRFSKKSGANEDR